MRGAHEALSSRRHGARKVRGYRAYFHREINLVMGAAVAEILVRRPPDPCLALAELLQGRPLEPASAPRPDAAPPDASLEVEAAAYLEKTGLRAALVQVVREAMVAQPDPLEAFLAGAFRRRVRRKSASRIVAIFGGASDLAAALKRRRKNLNHMKEPPAAQVPEHEPEDDEAAAGHMRDLLARAVSIARDRSEHELLPEAFPAGVRVEIGRMLGRGRFADVRRGVTATGAALAVKRFRFSGARMPRAVAAEALQELNAASLIFRGTQDAGRDRVSRLSMVLRDDSAAPDAASVGGAAAAAGAEPRLPRSLALAYELGDLGDLHVALHGGDGALPGGEARLVVLRDVALALRFLHGRGLVHRDVKSHNVLLFGGAIVRAKLGDLGAVAEAAAAEGLAPAGTLGWCAPEALDGAAGAPADVFALGMVAWDLATAPGAGVRRSGGNALAGLAPEDYAARVRDGVRPTLPETPPGSAWAAMAAAARACWATEPADRPTAAELLEAGRPLAGGGAGA